jgi:molybdopterin-guanine dinucleotide biosynthesis protein A
MTLSALLLAGGRSRRMGQDKATLIIAGEPLWQRQVRILREMRPSVLWISARTMLTWAPPNITVLPDIPPSQGPLSGVAAGLCRLQTSHLLALAADLPQMTTEHLRKLWGLARPGVGVIPKHGDFLEPLSAIYPVEARLAAEEALRSGDASLQHFAQTLLRRSQATIYNLTVDEQPLYLNMNTPADLPE